MSTRITVTTSSQGLLDRVKAVQAANRDGQLGKEKDAATEEQIAAAAAVRALAEERPTGGAPDTSVSRRTSAQREAGSVMGVEYTTQTIAGVPASTLRLTVGPPGQNPSVQADILQPSGAGATNQPSTSSDSSGQDAVLGFLVTYATPNFFGNSWVTEYPCGYTYQTGPGTAPTSSWTESRMPYVVSANYDDSAHYLLPLGNGTSVFVYVYSKLRTLTVYERLDRTERVSTNPRPTGPTLTGCGGQTGTYYDRETTYLSENIFSHVEERQVYELLAFLVSPTSVKAITVPTELEQRLQALHPPMEVNGTTEVLTSSSYTRYEYADLYSTSNEPRNYNGPITYGYATVPAFDAALHRTNSLHGQYPSGNDVLAKQYGLGELNTTSHEGDYFTPAVYRFIAASMDLSTAAAQTYSYMRSTFFTNAPSKYLAPCVVDGSCPLDQYDEPTTVVFDVTTQAPIDTSTSVTSTSFRTGTRYKVPLNGTWQYAVTYGWDWDKKAYCRQQLASLGFTAADLTP